MIKRIQFIAGEDKKDPGGKGREKESSLWQVDIRRIQEERGEKKNPVYSRWR